MKNLLVFATVSTLAGCISAYPDKDLGINAQAIATKQTVYFDSKIDDKQCLHDELVADLKAKFLQLGFAESMDGSESDMALKLISTCKFTQTDRDFATAFLPFISFFILPITTTVQYEVEIGVSEYGRGAKDYFFNDDITLVHHPFSFETARKQHKDYVKEAIPAMSSKVINALEADHFL